MYGKYIKDGDVKCENVGNENNYFDNICGNFVGNVVLGRLAMIAYKGRGLFSAPPLPICK